MARITKNHSQKGQTLLIVVLVMVIAVTVGLSVVSKSITSLRTSTEEANSAKALSAAEAGIQQTLQSGASIAGSTLPNTSYNTNIATQSGLEVLLNGGNVVPKDDGADLWLIDYNNGSPNYSIAWSGVSFDVYWGRSSDICDSNPLINTKAALEIAVISGPLPGTIKKFAYDPCGTRKSSNNFSAASAGGIVGGRTFPNRATIPVVSGLVARIIPLYANTVVGIRGAIALPSQGSLITSTGTSGPAGNAVVRKINVFQGYPQIPAQYFTHGLFWPK